MTYKFNKIKPFTKRLIGPNIIFPAAYLLLSAEKCVFGASNPNKIGNISFASQKNQASHALEDSDVDQGDPLEELPFLSGRGTLLNLGDYLCGAFVSSDTKEVYIVKLHSKDGWMQFAKEDAGALHLCYDDAKDQRIIKVDYQVIEHLCQSLRQSSDLGQHSMNKEDFYRKVANDSAWRNIEFYYKEPFGDLPIFKEAGITSSTEFTKEVYQKFSSSNSLISSSLSIKGNIASDALKNVEKKTFLLVKDKCDLVHLVKAMLESDADWGTKVGVVDTKEYITCPATLVKGALQFDSKEDLEKDVTHQLQDDYLKLPLEDYQYVYCFLNDGAYYHLIALDHLKPLLKQEIERLVENPYSVLPVPVAAPENSTDQIPPETLSDQDPTQPKCQVDGSPSEECAQQPNPITYNPEAEVTQSARPVVTSPMQFTGPILGSGSGIAPVTGSSSVPGAAPSAGSVVNGNKDPNEDTDHTKLPQPSSTPPPLTNSNPIPTPPPLPPPLPNSGANGVIPIPPPLPTLEEPPLPPATNGDKLKLAGSPKQTSGQFIMDELAEKLKNRYQEVEKQQQSIESFTKSRSEQNSHLTNESENDVLNNIEKKIDAAKAKRAEEPQGLEGALRKKLAEIEQATNPSESDSEDSEDSEEDEEDEEDDPDWNV
ncbi:hypothetical protein [Cardinium endosymbiont of Nabis limbatus]|uniref:hypothetical protein n=1 Tax=Cardinium endosymbiont of Nabis limbatus TaxID=3066217 RepID=UPI003AF380F9